MHSETFETFKQTIDHSYIMNLCKQSCLFAKNIIRRKFSHRIFVPLSLCKVVHSAIIIVSVQASNRAEYHHRKFNVSYERRFEQENLHFIFLHRRFSKWGWANEIIKLQRCIICIAFVRTFWYNNIIKISERWCFIWRQNQQIFMLVLNRR